MLTQEKKMRDAKGVVEYIGDTRIYIPIDEYEIEANVSKMVKYWYEVHQVGK